MSDIELPPTGSYPFCSVSPTKQNGYVAWIRDHSSYLTAGGIADQLATMGSYALGTLKNFLCLSPVFLLASLALGWFHFQIRERPYCLAATVALVVLVVACWVDRFKCCPSSALTRHANRARVGRCGGWAILGILVGIASLMVPLCVELLREHVHGLEWTWTKFTSVVIGGFGGLVAAQRAIPVTTGFKKAIAALLFGAIGISLLFATLVGLTYFFVYGNLLDPLWPGKFLLSRTPESSFAFWTLVALLVCFTVRLYGAWRGLGWSSLIVAILFCFAPLIPVYFFGSDEGYGARLNKVTQDIGKLSRPLALVVDKPFDQQHLSPNHAGRINHLKSQLNGLNDYFETQPPEQEKTDANNLAGVERFELTEFTKIYLSMAHHFVVDGYSFIDLNPLEKAKFRQAMAQMDRIGLVQLAQFRRAMASTDVKTNQLDGQKLSEVTQSDCLNAVVRAMVQNEAIVFKNEQAAAPEKLDEAVKPTRVATAFEDLKAFHIVARHQAEFAELTGQTVPTLGIPERKTSTAKGSLTIVPPSAALTHFESAIKEGLMARYLKSAPDSVVNSGATPAIAGLTDKSVADAFAFERVKRAHSPAKELLVLEVLKSKLKVGMVADAPSPENRHMRRMLVDVVVNGGEIARESALEILAEISVPVVDPKSETPVQERQYSTRIASAFEPSELIDIAMRKFVPVEGKSTALLPADQLVMNVAAGKEGDWYEFENIRQDLAAQSAAMKAGLYLYFAAVLGFIAFFTDVNSTSINGFYRNHLAEAFLLRGVNGIVSAEDDVKLTDLSPPGSLAPYLLINTAMNMQASGQLSLRDRRSEFFTFSKLFTGSKQTGYVATSTIEAAYPPTSLATAMAISAAAVAPNMGSYTNGLLTMLMGLLNIRLGYWVPNPKHLNAKRKTFDEIARLELSSQVYPRRHLVYGNQSERSRVPSDVDDLLTSDLVGLAFSGGGIRSAAINLGISQTLDLEMILRHVDYLSTVSGGGYTGSAVATLMRHPSNVSQTSPDSFVSIKKAADTAIAALTPTDINGKPISLHRLPVLSFGRELVSCLHDKSHWVNLSDGGHIENLAAIELLRRRCKIVIVGDGEADPDYAFGGLATLIRLASLELDTVIDINVDEIRPAKKTCKGDEPKLCNSHFAVGRITYPGSNAEGDRTGYLLYLKSSYTGREELLVREYRDSHPTFPHQSTADQFFDIGQFEAYRHLGNAIARQAIAELSTVGQQVANPSTNFSRYEEFEEALRQKSRQRLAESELP